MSEKKQGNRYQRLIEAIFLAHYKEGDENVPFKRADIEHFARELDIKLPKNLGDVVYSFRFRTELPEAVISRAPQGANWIIRLAGTGKYCFVAHKQATILPRPDLVTTKIPDATPGIISKYALSDEQALLAKLRYNRMIDIFTRVTCYSLQSHLRTTVSEMGQVETDEVYIGVDRRGAQYVFPVQAKGGKDRQSIVQIEQDFALCKEKFPSLVCRPIAAQFMADDVIALFEFEQEGEDIAIASEKHYRLTPQEEVTLDDLEAYRKRPSDF